MVREVEPSIIERDFFFDAIHQSLRLDRRPLFEHRPLSLSLSDDGDSVDCSIGLTRVSAHVSATIAKPRSDRPFEGLFQLSCEISPLASFVYDNSRSSDDEIHVARMLDKSLTRSGVIDRESLCILAGQKVWSIRLDLHFLNDEGNVLDCASLAAIAALQNFRRPDVSVSGEDIIIHSLQERVPVPLTLNHLPICLTFSIYQIGNEKPILILDPSLIEQQLSSGTITLALNPQKEICIVNKSGGVPLDIEEITKIIKLGCVKVREIDQKIKVFLEKNQPSTSIDLAAVQDR